MILQVVGELGRGREHREASGGEPGVPAVEGRLKRLNSSGLSHPRYQGRDLAQQVASTPELVRQVRVPNI